MVLVNFSTARSPSIQTSTSSTQTLHGGRSRKCRRGERENWKATGNEGPHAFVKPAFASALASAAGFVSIPETGGQLRPSYGQLQHQSLFRHPHRARLCRGSVPDRHGRNSHLSGDPAK